MEVVIHRFKGDCPICKTEVEFVSISKETLCYECQLRRKAAPEFVWTWTVTGSSKPAEQSQDVPAHQKSTRKKGRMVPIRVGNRAVWTNES